MNEITDSMLSDRAKRNLKNKRTPSQQLYDKLVYRPKAETLLDDEDNCVAIIDQFLMQFRKYLNEKNRA